MSERAPSALIPATCDERLKACILRCGPDALEAAISLMERNDPSSLEQALGLVHEGSDLSPPCFEIVAEAWDHYFHIRNMSWD